MGSFIRNDDDVVIDGEQFHLQDILSVVPEYVKRSKVHYYDGKAHYTSNGMHQVGCSIPCGMMEKIMQNMVGIKHCKMQRETDERHIESLRNIGDNNGSKLKRRP